MADTTEHPPGQEEAPAPQRRIPSWVRVGGAVLGGALLVCVLALALVVGGGDSALKPTSTPTPTDIPVPAKISIPLGYPGNPVTSNDQWTPVIQEFNGVEMALVPAGCFMMGSEDGEENECPVHEVCFKEPFWIDVYEVTNAQFATFGRVTGRASNWTESYRPRERITWAESAALCKLRGARLPTEAEWEYAARGPDGLVYPWGNTFVADNVVYDGNNPGSTALVASKPDGVSWIGAFDLSGNVWEWVNDWFDAEYYGTLADGVVNPQGPGSGEFRVLRGGSWVGADSHVRAAFRGWYNPVDEDYNFGFRCALSYTTSGVSSAPSNELTPTQAPTVDPIFGLAEAGATSNTDWISYVQEFNGVLMALVPTGCFMMGSEDSDDDDERPVHKVCFEEPFWIDVYEVTNEAFGSVGCEYSSSEPDQPRNCVTWADSLAHCEARGARLPTEAEWEYAARGPDGLVYPWGNSFDCSRGNFDDETKYSVGVVEGGAGCDGFDGTSQVGSFPGGVSWIGAFDLSGNVWEWVSDYYDSDYYGTLADGVVNPRGPGTGYCRVVRGSSWDSSHLVSATTRGRIDPSWPFGSNNTGFRCARSYSQ